MGATTARPTFWWDRACPEHAEIHPLRAIIIDADTALADNDDGDDLVPKAGLVELVMSLFLSGIWIAVVSKQDREWTQTLVRQLVGDGLVETIVTPDDIDEPGRDSEMYRIALWELGIRPEHALAIGGTASSLHAASAAGLPTVFLTDGYRNGDWFSDPVAVRSSYDGDDPLSADGCRRLHRRWGIRQHTRSRAA